ncbi:MAG: sialidase [Verrucomicrobia bacterium Tous-C9LFEB]|nr:MAG: sialidase [Verrucomicrobia bacterium Tous-C9LFEB]
MKSIPSRFGELITLFAALLALPLQAADLSADYAWKPLKIGGGGWVVGMDISPTEKNLIYVRTDVSGAYRWNAATSSWKRIVTAESMPPDSVEYGKYAGVDSLVSAPKDPDIAYMSFGGKPWGEVDGQIFKSTNRGDKWVATSFGNHHVKIEANGEGRQEGERLAVDPNNSDVVYFASKGDGLWFTRDGGAKWARVKEIPAGAPIHGVNTVVFDKDSGVLDGKVPRSKIIYVTVFEGGVFQSKDGGETWANIAAAGPGNASHYRDSAMGPDRTYYVVCDNEKGGVGSVWKYSVDGKWIDITPDHEQGKNTNYWGVAVDPTNAKHVVVTRNGGKMFVSKDQGKTWIFTLFRLNSPNIKWMHTQTNYWLSVGEIAFDPFDPGKLWFAEGFGVWWSKELKAPLIEWQAASEGIEEVCGNDVIAPPGGKAVGAMWDAGVFYFGDPDTYTSQRAYPNFMSAWALDWCAADPKFLVGVFQNHLNFKPHTNSSGYSTDGGQTWTRFPLVESEKIPDELKYGVIAVSANSTDKIVWCPAENKLPYYTADRGATWTQSSFGGPTTTGFVSFPMSMKPLCADRVLPDTFYFYRPEEGVYRSTDGGATFTKVGNPVSNRYNAILKSTPGKAGDLWFAEGLVGGVWHSTDGGATWLQLPGIKLAFNIGLGKAEKEGGYHTLFVVGIGDNGHGIYRSTDVGQSWDKVGDYPLGIFDFIDAMDGDKNEFGKVYVGFCGSGFAYGAVAKKP